MRIFNFGTFMICVLLISAITGCYGATSLAEKEVNSLVGGCSKCWLNCGAPCSDWGEACETTDDCTSPCSAVGEVQTSCSSDGYANKKCTEHKDDPKYCGYKYKKTYCWYDSDAERNACYHSEEDLNQPCPGDWAEGNLCVDVYVCKATVDHEENKL